MTKREQMMKDFENGLLENHLIEIEVADSGGIGIEIAGVGAGINISELMGDMLPKKTKKRKVTVAEARKILESEEADKLIDMDEVTSTAIERAEPRRHHLFGRDRQNCGKVTLAGGRMLVVMASRETFCRSLRVLL